MGAGGEMRMRESITAARDLELKDDDLISRGNIIPCESLSNPSLDRSSFRKVLQSTLSTQSKLVFA